MKKWKIKNWICAIYTMCVLAVAFTAVEVNALEIQEAELREVARTTANNFIQMETHTEGDYEYAIDNENTYAVIMKYTGKEENVVTPTTLGNYPVYGINSLAFSRVDTMKTLTVSEGVQYIYTDGVYMCSNLEEVYLPKSLIGCGMAFINDTTLGGSLKNIYLAEGNVYLQIVDGILYSADMNTLMLYPCADPRETLTIPEGVKEIGCEAFNSAFNLKEIKLPNSVKTISSWAFNGCRSLESINIPESCEHLGQYLFMHSKIKKIHIPASVTSVQYGCLDAMQYLEEITVDEKNEFLFMDDGALCQESEHGFTADMEYYVLGKHVIAYPINSKQTICRLSEGIEGIQYDAFAGCKNLKEIELPSTFKWMEQFALANDSINKIVFKGDAPRFETPCFPAEADIYYPMNNDTWNEAVFEKITEYGEFNWIPYYLPDPGTMDGTDDGGDAIGTEDGGDADGTDDAEDVVGTGDGTGDGEEGVGTGDGDSGTDDVVKTGIWAEEILDQEYTGSAIKVKPVVYDGEDLLTLNKDYTLSYKNNKKVGTATVIVKGKGNYKGKYSFNFEIIPRDITKEGEQLYAVLKKGKTLVNVKPTVTTMVNGKSKKLGSKDCDVDLGYKVGDTGETGDTYNITVTGKGNYTGTIVYPVTFVANKNMLMKNAKITVNPKKINWTGSAIEPNVVVKAGGKTLTKDTDYTVEYENNIASGKATVIVEGIENKMFGAKTANFTIKGLNIKKEATVDPIAAVDYNGEAHYPTPVVKAKDGTELVAGVHYLVTGYAKNEKPGTAVISIQGIGKYEGKMTAKFKINKVKLTDANVVVEPSVEYTKAGAKAGVTVTVGDKVLVNGVDYKVTYKNNKKVGVATVTVAGKGGYTGKVKDLAFEVTPNIFADIVVKPIAVVDGTPLKKVKVIVTDKGKKLDKKEYTMTYNIISKEGVLREATGEDIVKAGDYVNVNVYAAKNTNYVAGNCVTAGFGVGNKTIAKAKVKIASKEYTGEEVTLEEKDFLYVKVGKDELTLGQDFIIRDYSNNTTTGNNASVTIEGVGDYCGTKTVKFKITGRNVKENWADAFAEFWKEIF